MRRFYKTDDRGVQYVGRSYRGALPRGWATCGHCGRSWNDEKSTSVTPAPSGRCPFEYEHVYRSKRSNPSSYAGDPYWTRARFKGVCCKCNGVVRKGDPIYYYPKGKRVYCDGSSCGKAANADFRSMVEDEDFYNRRQNPSGSKVQVRVTLNSGAVVLATFSKSKWPKTMNGRDALISRTVGGSHWRRWDEITTRSNPSHPDCPGVSARHQHYQGKCSTDWNWGTGKASAVGIKTWPKHGVVAMVRPSWEAGLWDWEVKVNGKVVADGNAKSSNHAKKWCSDTVGRMFGGSRSRTNPSLGMPGMPHTWVTASGAKVKAGDLIEYVHKSGPGAPVVRRKKVIKYLVFDDHVMVQSGNNGDYVDDRNFIRVVRRA